jgi:hypothetical protein
LRAAAVDCAAWQLCHFENAASALDQRVQAYSAEPSAAGRELAAAAWKEAMLAWSRVELFQFGPLASTNETAGKDTFQGQGLREPIYAWPAVGRCRVEEEVLEQSFAGDELTGVFTSARGLTALEYLLFYDGTDTACASSSTTTAWAALDPEELAANKLAYARALSDDVRTRALALSGLYANSGDYRQSFVDASGYPSAQDALNVLAWALVYIEREVKDWKLGVPAQYTGTSPVTVPESPYAGIGKEMLRENLLGFRSLYQGCGKSGEGLGFDDWLVEAGHAELANDMTLAWQAAFDATEAFPPLLSASVDEFKALYAVLKGLTDLLKAEFFGAGSPLALELPAGVASDTD